MSFENATATDHLDLLARLKTFCESTIAPAGERWAVERYTGYDLVVFDSELAGSEARLVYDGSQGTEWLTAIGQNLPTHIGARFVSGIEVDRVVIRASDSPTRAPDDFTLEYSANGSTWTPLETFAAGSWGSQEQKQFDVSAGSPGPQPYWRIAITTNGGAADHTSIAELRFIETISGNDFNHAEEAQLIMRGPGLAAADQIYVGVQSYSEPESDIYNWRLAAFDGYVAGLPFTGQPGSYGTPVGYPLWNQSIEYWLAANGRRFALVSKVETTYQTCYLGLLLPFATPGQWPYPLCVAGMLPTDEVKRYSDTGIIGPWSAASSRLRIRLADGASWIEPDCWPYQNTSANHREVPGGYPLIPVVLDDENGVYGQLDGISLVSGFGNAVENLVQIGGTDHLVVQDVYRTGLRDYHALKLG